MHGFTGNPTEVLPLGESLAGAGFAVQGVLFPGHGGLPADLAGFSWSRWTEHAFDALRELQRRYKFVGVAGLSMGALVGLHLAAHNKGVHGIVAMSTPARINSPYIGLVRYARFLQPWFGPLDKADFSNQQLRASLLRQLPPGVVVDFDNPKHVQEVRKMARVPMSALDQLIKLNKQVVSELPQVAAPVLFAQGSHDRLIAPRSAEILFEQTASANKQIVNLENSAHMLPLEPDARQLEQLAISFFLKHMGASSV